MAARLISGEHGQADPKDSVPTDCSTSSDAGLDSATARVRDSGATLLIVHAEAAHLAAHPWAETSVDFRLPTKAKDLFADEIHLVADLLPYVPGK